MTRARNTFFIFMTALFTGMLSTPAHAYLDPGTGSIILQGLIAGAAMISLTLKMYWYKFTSFFRKDDESEDDSEEDKSTEPAKQEQN